jgi:hypothetical protein
MVDEGNCFVAFASSDNGVLFERYPPGNGAFCVDHRGIGSDVGTGSARSPPVMALARA